MAGERVRRCDLFTFPFSSLNTVISKVSQDISLNTYANTYLNTYLRGGVGTHWCSSDKLFTYPEATFFFSLFFFFSFFKFS